MGGHASRLVSRLIPSNPFNPFQQVISGGSQACLLEFGKRLSDNETDNFQFHPRASKGTNCLDGNFGQDANFRHSKIKASPTGINKKVIAAL